MNAVVILTHFIDEHVIKLFERLRDEVPEQHEVFLALNSGAGECAIPQLAEPFSDRIFLCNTASLLALGYPEKCKPLGWTGKGWTVNPGNADVIVLAFYHAHPGYSYYWGVEYDVHFEGNWGFMFQRFELSSAHLLGTTLYHAGRVSYNKRISPPFRNPHDPAMGAEHAIRGFFPLFRLSAILLDEIDRGYRQGWGGHYELTWGTIAVANKLAIEDIGGNGEYVRPENRNAFYFNTLRAVTLSPGTFVWRADFVRPLPKPNTLWHPIKPAGNYHNWLPLSRETRWHRQVVRQTKYLLWSLVIRLWFALIWRRQPN